MLAGMARHAMALRAYASVDWSTKTYGFVIGQSSHSVSAGCSDFTAKPVHFTESVSVSASWVVAKRGEVEILIFLNFESKNTVPISAVSQELS